MSNIEIEIVSQPGHTVDIDEVLADETAFVILSGSAAGHVHTQTVAAATWTINHNLGHRPVVDVFVGALKIGCSVLHVSDNQCQVLLAAPYTGSARLI